MKRLLIQSDDYGITDAVSAGIIKGVTEGIVRNTGLFVNMTNSKKAANEIRNIDVCLGVDINLVAGKPISNPKDVPSLVGEEGMFITSREQIGKNKVRTVQGLITEFENDPYPYDEVLFEIENQVKKFVEYVGRKPEYIHPHSLCTPNTIKAMKEVADKYEVVFSLDIIENDNFKYLLEKNLMSKGKSLEEQMREDKKRNFLESDLPSIKDGETAIFITHCGFIDYELFKYSSLTLERMLDLDIVIDERIINYINDNQIQLITYRDLM